MKQRMAVITMLYGAGPKSLLRWAAGVLQPRHSQAAVLGWGMTDHVGARVAGHGGAHLRRRLGRWHAEHRDLRTNGHRHRTAPQIGSFHVADR